MQKLARSLCRSKELAKKMMEVEPELERLFNAMPNISDDVCKILVLRPGSMVEWLELQSLRHFKEPGRNWGSDWSFWQTIVASVLERDSLGDASAI